MALSWAASRVVDACYELSNRHKRVWLALWSLDRGPDRAYISAAGLARRLGMGEVTVEKARRELKAWALLASGPRPGRNDTTWWPLLPGQCLPRRERSTNDEIYALADVLDDLLRIAKEDAGPQPDEPPGGVPEHTSTVKGGGVSRDTSRTRRRGVSGYTSQGPPGGVSQYASSEAADGVPQYASPAAGQPEGGVPRYASRGGGVGGEVSDLPEVGTTSPTSTSTPEVGKELGSELGAFARERKAEVGGKSDDTYVDWRTLLEKPETTPPPVLTRGAFRGLH